MGLFSIIERKEGFSDTAKMRADARSGEIEETNTIQGWNIFQVVLSYKTKSLIYWIQAKAET